MGVPHPHPEYKKSFENDAQSSDNINFLKVQWSSRQLPTVRLVGEDTEREVRQSATWSLPGRAGRPAAQACLWGGRE